MSILDDLPTAVTPADVEMELTCSGPTGCGHVFQVGDIYRGVFAGFKDNPFTDDVHPAFIIVCEGCAS